MDRCVSRDRRVMSSGATFRDCIAVSQLDYAMLVKLYWSRIVHCTGQRVSTVMVKEYPLYWSRSVQCTGQGVSTVQV